MKKILSSSLFSAVCLMSCINSVWSSGNYYTDESGVEWNQIGSLSVYLRDMGDSDLERSAILRPEEVSETPHPVTEIFIGSYRGDIGRKNRFRILIELHRENDDLKRDLESAHIGESSFPFYSRFWNNPEGSLVEFLATFVRHNLIPNDLTVHVLELINNTYPHEEYRTVIEEYRAEVMAERERTMQENMPAREGVWEPLV